MNTIKINKSYNDFLIESILKLEGIDKDKSLIENDSAYVKDLLEFDYGIKVDKNNIIQEADFGQTVRNISDKIASSMKNVIGKTAGILKSVLSSIFNFIKNYWKALTAIGAVVGVGFIAYLVKRGAVINGYISKGMGIKETLDKYYQILYSQDKAPAMRIATKYSKADLEKSKGLEKIKMLSRNYREDFKKVLNYVELGFQFIKDSIQTAKKDIKDKSKNYKRVISALKTLVSSYKSILSALEKFFVSVGKKLNVSYEYVTNKIKFSSKKAENIISGIEKINPNELKK